ncbi:MAG TPA: Minf_1886 family protein [Steroidobacteraceae bacterium]|nr:Minf_1886 family protein [Steroidobacteraceae bacterium]
MSTLLAARDQSEGVLLLLERFRDGIMDRIRTKETRFEEDAYLFVLKALEYSQTHLTERRHITGRELAFSCRDLALQMYGVMAQVVLEHWGVRATSDIGDIVFVLVDLGYLISQPTDNRADFIGVYNFDRAFEHEYPWNAAALV